MKLASQIEEKCDILIRARTRLADIAHPISHMTEEIKKSYLKCIVYVSLADKVIHDSESVLLEDLADSLNLSVETIDSCIGFASRKVDLSHFASDISNIVQNNVKNICLCDMFLMAYIDENYIGIENAAIQGFAEKFGIQHHFENLKKIAGSVYTERYEDALKIMSSIPSALYLEQWIKVFKADSIQTLNFSDNIIKAPQDTGNTTVSKMAHSPIKETIETCQKEVLSQLGKLESLLSKKGKNNQSKDPQIPELLKTIGEQKEKVKDLRMTLAFVGVMKSGKSTTINAVVGANVLPNRSGAMTTLPTLITHEKGRVEPELFLNKNEPFNAAIASIKEVLKKQKTANTFEYQGKLYENTIKKIMNGELSEIPKTYKGTREIYDFMEVINDISRISTDEIFQINNPIDVYTSINDFPEIKVEFAYLSDRNISSQGKLTIIDTPGPNEAGQGKLIGIVKRQLKEASSIVCVIDPFQKNSEAQNDMMAWIKNAQDEDDVPVFMFINKLDQLKPEEKDPEKQKPMILNLYPNFKNKKGKLCSVGGRTYCISSLNALISNQASRALTIYKKLPHWKEEPWVETFLERSYGSDWNDDDCISKPTEEHLNKSQKMWDRSLMQKPLDEVISAAIEKSAPLCLKSALDQIIREAGEIKKQSRVRLKGLNTEIENLEVIIKESSDTIQKMEAIAKLSEAEKEKTLKKIRDEIDKVLNGVENQVISKIKDKAIKKLACHPEKKRSLAQKFFNIFSPQQRQQEVKDLENDYIEFESENEAQCFMNEIIGDLPSIVKNEIVNMSEQLKADCNNQQKALGENIKSKILSCSSKLNETMQDQFGISVTIKEPNFPDINLDIDIASSSLISSRIKTYNTYERRWYTFWLRKHEKSHKSIHYNISLNEAKKKVKECIEGVCKQSQNILNDFIEQSFKTNLDSYIKEVVSQIKSFKASVQSSITEHKCSEEEKKNLQSPFKEIEEDSEVLESRAIKIQKSLGIAN